MPYRDSDGTKTITADGADLRDTPEAKRIAASETDAAEIRPGDCLGRYTVRSLIGAGGMGQVFAALDPELGRTVALKLIHPDRLLQSPLAHARLLREAQALARLHHPNVVTVYDVGAEGQQVFVAMELVDGPTLAEWLRATGRSWREVLVPFLAAGRGLAAAHAAGIVHRDFKPLNVIVGADRVVVLDFGLARAGNDEPLDPPRKGVLDTDLTLTGERMGTPLYMAPEQQAGGAVTAQADQFAFCVALWEGLHRSRPGGATRADVPGWLNAAVTRGLAPDPGSRWPSMDALLAALSRDPAGRRRRVAAVAAVISLGAVAVWGVARSHTIDPCAGGATRLAGVWDGPRKDAVRAAFAATAFPFAGDAWRGASARLDAYAARWVDMHGESCRATRVDGRQSDTLMDLRMACLDRRRAVLGALADVWAKGVDAAAVAVAIDAAGELAPLEECADARALTDRTPLPPDPGLAARVAAARTRLDGVQALSLAHRWADARDAVAPVRAEADAIGWPPLRAEAAFTEADIRQGLSDPGAETPFLDAVRLAGEARDDRLAARSMVKLVKNLAADSVSAERALLIGDLAQGAIARAGNDVGLRALLLGHRGDALMTAGKFGAARIAFVAARAFATAAFGPDDSATLWNDTETARAVLAQGDAAAARRLLDDTVARMVRLLGEEHPFVASTLNFLGLALEDLGDYDRAAEQLRRSLAIKERIGGTEAAWSATTLTNLGRVQLTRGHDDEAEALHQRALSIRTRLFGPDHVLIAASLGELAEVRRKQRRFDEALELHRRALAIEMKTYGPAHPAIPHRLTLMGDVLDTRGDPAGAAELYRRALDANRQALGPDHLNTLRSMTFLAAELARLHRCGEARPLLDAAAAGIEKALGADSVYVGEALVERAKCDLAEGRPALAAARLERAIAIEVQASDFTIDRGHYRWQLARALWSMGRRADAVVAARLAERELDGNADGAEDRAAVQAWLAGRR